MDYNQYTEWVSMGRLVKGLVLATTVWILVGIALVVAFLPLDFETMVGIGIALTVLVFILLVFVNFRGIRINVTSDRLIVSYGLFNKRSIKFDEIESCRIVKASFGRYGGIGVRFGFDGSTAYTTSFGNAVEITPKKGRVFVFSSNTLQQICELINKNSKISNFPRQC
jgi:hypothetical protein